jgi:hypothetical protein
MLLGEGADLSSPNHDDTDGGILSQERCGQERPHLFPGADDYSDRKLGFALWRLEIVDVNGLAVDHGAPGDRATGHGYPRG